MKLPGWQSLREKALEKLGANEDTVNRLLFRTRTEVDPLEIEFFRGFRQGVMYVLDGLPAGVEPEIKRVLARQEKEGTS